MQEDSFRNIRTLLSSERPDELHRGLDLAGIEIIKAGSREAKPLFEMVSTLFYIDSLDRPELLPVLERAINLAAGFGAGMIPILIKNLNAGDIKAQSAIAHVLGRIGAESIKPMMASYASATDPTLRAFILYSLGKIKSPEVVQAAALAVEAAQSSALELRDTATRTLGKLVESIPPGGLSEELKQRFIIALHNNLCDPNASVRSKAVRSLGKLSKYGHLAESERSRLKATCRRILGDDDNNWDNAYVVRKEAEEALRYT
jgi:HEAT repeat protein